MKKLILALLLAALCTVVTGQPGNLDPSFGNNGIVRTDFGSTGILYDNQCKVVLLHPDGSFYLVFQMNRQAFITHRFANGALDLAYGEGGYSVPVYMREPTAVMQADGKIVVGGTTPLGNEDFVLARFNTNGFLDNSFSGDGKLVTDFFGNRDDLFGLAVQNDGKIIAAGRTYNNINDRFALARYNPDGSLDNSFSGDGLQITAISISDGATSVAVHTDGKIVAAGLSSNGATISMAIVRYLTDGTPDNTFSGDGVQLITEGWFSVARSVVIQPDGKVVAGGFSLNAFNQMRFIVVRLNTDGLPDNSFSGNGIQTDQFPGGDALIHDIALQTDGKIVATGYSNIPGYQEFTIARYTTGGILDNSFSGDGYDVPNVSVNPPFISTGAAFSVAIFPDTRIIIAGTYIYTMAFAAVRYNNNGTLDNSLDGDGILKDHKPSGRTSYRGSATQADGKIVVAGVTELENGELNFAVARYNINGTLDNSFSGDGKLIIDFAPAKSEASAVAIQPDGKIVIAGTAYNNGNSDFAVARLNADGTPDNSFSGDGKLLTDVRGYNDGALGLAIRPDGRIVIAGFSNLFGADDDFAVVQYLADGTPDNSFSGDGKQTTDPGSSHDVANDLAIQPDGKIILVGTRGATATIGHSDIALVRYNTDGSPDASFDGEGIVITDATGMYDQGMAIAIDATGKIVVAGTGGPEFVVLRYNTTGLPDNSFSGDAKQFVNFGFFAFATSLVIQPDGKLIVGGVAGSSLENDFALARLNADGTPDNSFSGDGKVLYDFGYGEDFLYSLSLSGNRIYAAGQTVYGGQLGAVAAFSIGEAITCNLTAAIPDAFTLANGVNANTVYIGYAPAADLTLTVQPSGGTGPYIYAWSNGATTASITVMPAVATNYSVTVTDASGCSTTVNKLVNVVDVRCGNKMDKVMICRVPPGNAANASTLCVNANAVASQLGNGSYLGSCSPALITTKGISPAAIEENIGLRVYPNPSRVSFRIILNSSNNTHVNMVVWDAVGRVIEQRSVNANQIVSLGNNYRPGVYIIELTQDKEKFRTKLVKQ